MSFTPIIAQHCEIDTDSCVRYALSLLLSTLIVITSITFIYRLKKKIGKFTFELIPMMTSASQAILHMFQFSLINNNQMVLTANYLQIITFALVGECFRYLHRKINYGTYQIRRTENYVLIIYLSFFVIQFISICVTDTKHCSTGFKLSLILIVLQVLFTSCIIYFYGVKVQKRINYISQKFYNSDSDILESFPVEKIRQIILLIYSLLINTLIYIVILYIAYFQTNDALCDFSITELNGKHNLLLGLFTLTQLLPCFYVPFAFHYQEFKTSNNEIFDVDSRQDSFVNNTQYKMDQNQYFVDKILH